MNSIITLCFLLLCSIAHSQCPPGSLTSGAGRKISDEGGDEIDYLYENGEKIEQKKSFHKIWRDLHSWI